MKYLSFIAAALFLLAPFEAFATPSLADTPNITTHSYHIVTSLSFTYTVPSGSNQVLVVFIGSNAGGSNFTIKQNGQGLTRVNNSITGQCSSNFGTNSSWFAYVAAPTSGTFSMTSSSTMNTEVGVFTINDADQTNPIDAYFCQETINSVNISTTTPSANDFLIDWLTAGTYGPLNHGAGQTEYVNFNDSALLFGIYGSYVVGSSSAPQLQAMYENYNNSGLISTLQMLAIKGIATVSTAVINATTFISSF